MKTRLILIIYISVLTLVSLNYFYAQFLPEAVKHVRLLIVGTSILIGLKYIFSHGFKGLIVPLQLMIFAMLFSIFISYLTWNQSIGYGLLITVPYLLWPIFFLLLHYKVPIKTVENVVVSFGIIYIILYIIQFSMPGRVLFFDSPKEEFKETRGIIRVLFPGTGIFFLTIFIAITKLTSQDKNRIFWLIITICGFLIPIMQVTRYFIVSMLMVYAFHFSFNLSVSKKILIVFSIGISSLYFSNLNIPVIEGLMDQQEKNMSDGTQDIRVIAFNYYVFEFPPTAYNYFFGNGMEHGRSSYGSFIQRLKDFGLYTSDIGIFGLYVYFGIIPIIVWIILWYKIFKVKLPKEYYYVKYYMFFMLVGIFTSHSLYSVNFLIATIFSLYICQKLMIKKEAMDRVKLLLLNHMKKKLDKLNEPQLIYTNKSI